MDVREAIRSRRSIKKFAARAVTRTEIEQLLELAVLAPNHRMTEPWEFLVMGEAAKRAYGAALGQRKARKVEDPGAAEAVRMKVLEETSAIPAMVAVTVSQAADPEVREEDYAATFMGVENILLGARALGLGTHLRTGAVMNDPEVRAALEVADERRVVAIIQLGAPAEEPAPRRRAPAAEKTRWLS